MTMVSNNYTKERILFYSRLGKKAVTMEKLLAKEQLKASRTGIDKFLKRYHRTGTSLY